MDFNHYLIQIATNAQTIQQLTAGVSDEQARWKPDAESWSILEVINHLYDEEQFDFRVRLDHILHKPDIEPPPNEPDRWVTERAYNERQLDVSLDNFLQEREKSLAWLRGLESPNWEATITTPWRTISAGDMFLSWVAHDMLHMRQLVELQFLWLRETIKPNEIGYAGDW